jgi:hypothetical protein
MFVLNIGFGRNAAPFATLVLIHCALKAIGEAHPPRVAAQRIRTRGMAF